MNNDKDMLTLYRRLARYEGMLGAVAVAAFTGIALALVALGLATWSLIR